jgi:hypothetical protein
VEALATLWTAREPFRLPSGAQRAIWAEADPASDEAAVSRPRRAGEPSSEFDIGRAVGVTKIGRPDLSRRAGTTKRSGSRPGAKRGEPWHGAEEARLGTARKRRAAARRGRGEPWHGAEEARRGTARKRHGAEEASCGTARKRQAAARRGRGELRHGAEEARRGRGEARRAARTWAGPEGHVARPPAARGAGRLPGARSRAAWRARPAVRATSRDGGTPKSVAGFLPPARRGSAGASTRDEAMSSMRCALGFAAVDGGNGARRARG